MATSCVLHYLRVARLGRLMENPVREERVDGPSGSRPPLDGVSRESGLLFKAPIKHEHASGVALGLALVLSMTALPGEPGFLNP